MARDDYYMGSLANLDPTRGAYPDWQEPPDEGAWSRGVAAAADINARPSPQPTPRPGWGGNLAEIGGRMGAIAKAHDPFAVPYAMSHFQPEVPGQWSEGDEQRLRDLNEKVGDWAPQTAFGMTFDPFRFGQRGAVTSGAGSKIIQPAERPIGSVAEQAPIRAYHSSPHDFDRFDLSKIGTGEGAQVYGHGIYAAENPAVSGQGGEYWKQFQRRFEGTPEGHAANELMVAGFDRDKAIAASRRNLEDLRRFHQDMQTRPNYDQAYYEKLLKLRENQQTLLESNKPVGPRTYEVAIHAKPEQFLDYDKPLVGGQSPQVADALKQMGVQAEFKGPIPRTGRDVNDLVANQVLPLGRATPANISAALNEAGIPGIRYLDQGSRGPIPKSMQHALRAQGMTDIPRTSNYVVFDPARIDILRKYGLAGAVPAMGALAAQDRYQGVQ